MTESFRLKSATYAGLDGEEVRVDIVGEASPDGTWTTAITGRNGVGKSRLLSQIAALFEAVEAKKPRSGPAVSVDYSIGSLHCKVSLSKGRVETTIGGLPVDPALLPMPRAVAAVTTTAFDKFPLPSARVSVGNAPPVAPLYRYLGLKDSRGRISATAGVHRALDELFAAVRMDEPRRSRIADVFSDLEYEPRIEVAYRWTRRGSAFVKAGGDGREKGYDLFLESSMHGDRTWSRFDKSYFEDPYKRRDLSSAAELLQKWGTSRGLVLIADFEQPEFAHAEHLRSAQLLKRLGMVEMESVTLIRAESGSRLDLRDASSGEFSLVTAFLGIASAIDDQSLVLIDEPEISLHPDWQSGYLNLLSRAFEPFRGSHFIVATHSPLIVSGIEATHGNVLSLEDSPLNGDARNFSGKSTDEVLIGAFNVAGKNNLYLKHSLVRALRMAADRKFDTPEFVKLMRLLKQATRASGVNDGVREVVSDLEETVERAQVNGQ